MSKKQKHQLRHEVKKILVNLDTRWVTAASFEVCKNLSTLIDGFAEKEIKHVLAWTCFFPGEVNLTPFINHQLELRSVYLPRVNENKSMDFLQVNNNWFDTAESGLHGIPEPQYKLAASFDISLAEESVVIVPGLAFDNDGNRLGRGMGYYDRFLSKGMMNSLKIGVGFSLQCLEKVPFESHDVQLDWLCTESGFTKVKS